MNHKRNAKLVKAVRSALDNLYEGTAVYKIKPIVTPDVYVTQNTQDKIEQLKTRTSDVTKEALADIFKDWPKERYD